MKLLSFGAILWDIIEGVEHIGGAPFNLAAHAAKLGVDTHFMSAVGRDDLGRRARETILRMGVSDRLVADVDYPTGVVDVVLDGQGAPTFTIREPSAWDHIEATDDEIDWVNAQVFDCFCFGSLEQRCPVTRSTLRRVLEACRFDRVLCDINLRMQYYDRERVEYCLNASDVLKLNDDEAIEVGDMLGLGANEASVCESLRATHGVDIVCVTAGADGCRIYTADGATACPGYKVDVADTVGSGDAFTAAFLTRLQAGATVQEAGNYACRLGALVASRSGAVPEYDVEMLSGE